MIVIDMPVNDEDGEEQQEEGAVVSFDHGQHSAAKAPAITRPIFGRR